MSRVADMQRQLEQGSQQAQGEVLELLLEEQLAAAFPLDEITEVKKGVRGRGGGRRDRDDDATISSRALIVGNAPVRTGRR